VGIGYLLLKTVTEKIKMLGVRETKEN